MGTHTFHKVDFNWKEIKEKDDEVEIWMTEMRGTDEGKLERKKESHYSGKKNFERKRVKEKRIKPKEARKEEIY